MAKTAQPQFMTFKRLPQLPSASNTPGSKSSKLLTLQESSRSSQIFPNIEDEQSESNKSTNNNKFGGDPSLFGRFVRKKYDSDIDKEKSVSKKKYNPLHLYSHNSNKEVSVSTKSAPNNILLLPLKPPRNEYSHINDDDVDDDEEEEDDDVILITNIGDTTTNASNGTHIFRRKRGVPKTNIIGDESEDDDAYNETTEVSQTEISQLTASKRPRAASSQSISSSKYSQYSMRDELNLQKLIINTTMEMHSVLPLVQTQTTDISEFEGETMTVRDSTLCTFDGFETMHENGENMNSQRCVKNTSKQYETRYGFEFYVNLRNMVSLLTLIAIGTLQFVYYRYYYLCGIFTSITCILYILLFIPSIQHSLSEECLCSFGLIVIRLFHIMSILTIFVGVETCLFHYERVVNVESTNDNEELHVWFAFLWTFIILAIVMCYLQNVYIIKYDEFVVIKWKLIHWCKAQYYINDDGSWRADLHPISGCDGLLTTFLFITTFAAIICAVVCIHKMEMVMKTYGA